MFVGRAEEGICDVVLRDGSTLGLRPVREDDVPALAVFFENLSPESRYYRFTFIADNDEKFNYSFHLDDPAVNYFTHREILSLAMKKV